MLININNIERRFKSLDINYIDVRNKKGMPYINNLAIILCLKLSRCLMQNFSIR
tara:strand:- start:1183 stop:1344 length:162 start_codon:yes stop_codon:yes gene_type:complete